MAIGLVTALAILAIPFIAAAVSVGSLILDGRRDRKAAAADHAAWCAAKDRQFAERLARFKRIHRLA